MDFFQVYTRKDDHVNNEQKETSVAPTFLDATEWSGEYINIIRTVARFGSKPFNEAHIGRWPKSIRQDFARARASHRKAKYRCANTTQGAAAMVAAIEAAKAAWPEAAEVASQLRMAEKRWTTFLKTPPLHRPAGSYSEIAREIWFLPSADEERASQERRETAKELRKSAWVVGEARERCIHCKNSPTISSVWGERLIADRQLAQVIADRKLAITPVGQEATARAITRDRELVSLRLMQWPVSSETPDLSTDDNAESPWGGSGLEQLRLQAQRAENYERSVNTAAQRVVRLRQRERELRNDPDRRGELRQVRKRLDAACVEHKSCVLAQSNDRRLSTAYEEWGGAQHGFGATYRSEMRMRVQSIDGPIARPCTTHPERRSPAIVVPAEDIGDHHVRTYWKRRVKLSSEIQRVMPQKVRGKPTKPSDSKKSNKIAEATSAPSGLAVLNFSARDAELHVLNCLERFPTLHRKALSAQCQPALQRLIRAGRVAVAGAAPNEEFTIVTRRPTSVHLITPTDHPEPKQPNQKSVSVLDVTDGRPSLLQGSRPRPVEDTRNPYRSRKEVDALFDNAVTEGFIRWFSRNRNSRRQST